MSQQQYKYTWKIEDFDKSVSLEFAAFGIDWKIERKKNKDNTMAIFLQPIQNTMIRIKFTIGIIKENNYPINLSFEKTYTNSVGWGFTKIEISSPFGNLSIDITIDNLSNNINTLLLTALNNKCNLNTSKITDLYNSLLHQKTITDFNDDLEIGVITKKLHRYITTKKSLEENLDEIEGLCTRYKKNLDYLDNGILLLKNLVEFYQDSTIRDLSTSYQTDLFTWHKYKTTNYNLDMEKIDNDIQNMTINNEDDYLKKVTDVLKQANDDALEHITAIKNLIEKYDDFHVEAGRQQNIIDAHIESLNNKIVDAEKEIQYKTEIITALESKDDTLNVLEKLLEKKETIEYTCPITLIKMTDPVVAEDGHTYEKQAIDEWWKLHKTSPITKQAISNKFIPNRIIIK